MLSSTAHCLCGAVTITATNINPKLTACHCESCRLWGGGAYLAVRCGTQVSIQGADKVTLFDSSPWASRGFSATCGTHLFYKLNKTGEYNLSAGLFPQIQEFTMDTA